MICGRCGRPEASKVVRGNTGLTLDVCPPCADVLLKISGVELVSQIIGTQDTGGAKDVQEVTAGRCRRCGQTGELTNHSRVCEVCQRRIRGRKKEKSCGEETDP